MRTQVILLAVAALVASALLPPDSLASFQSPIPRPPLDPAWVCQQLGNCPPPPKEHHESTYFTVTLAPAAPPAIDWLAVPYQFGPDD